MSDTNNIKDISPKDAWALLSSDDKAVLVDVRTRAEWAYVGMPDLSGIGKQVVTIEWKLLNGALNEEFISQLSSVVPQGEASVLLMLCRSGVRSLAAGVEARKAGYAEVFNVADGFEGQHNSQGQRKSVSGWCFDGLPWKQE